MNLDRVSAVIRPRSYAESIDLGFTMVRAWWRPIYGAWVVQVLPVAALLFVTLYRQPWIAALILWWLKPLFDRAPLYVVSRALFGATPTVGQTLRALPGQLGRDVVLGLTLYRFDWLRSFRLPIWQLEGVRGYRRSKRTRVLIKHVHRDSTGEGGHVAETLAAICLGFEFTLTLVPLAAVAMLTPASRVEDLGAALFDPAAAAHLPLAWTVLGAWLIAMSVVEPFYVAAGFGLYVNRRTRLEAWDLEVAFRRLASRHAAAAGRIAVALCCALTGFGLVAAENTNTPTDEAAPGAAAVATAPETDADRVVREVLDDPVFGSEETRKVLDLRFRPDVPSAEGFGTLLGLSSAVAALLAKLLWVLLVGALVSLVILVVIRASAAAAPRGPAPEPVEPPDVVLGLAVKRESLPEDVVGHARALWDSGSRQEAVRLLYRAALARLIADGLPIKDSATEGDCLRLAATHVGREGLAYFRLLTRTWERGTYGHEPPTEEAGEALLGPWSTHFGAVS